MPRYPFLSRSLICLDLFGFHCIAHTHYNDPLQSLVRLPFLSGVLIQLQLKLKELFLFIALTRYPSITSLSHQISEEFAQRLPFCLIKCF